MARLTDLFHWKAPRSHPGADPVWDDFGTSHCAIQSSPHGPIRTLPDARTAWSTAVCSCRHCVQSIPAAGIACSICKSGSASSTGHMPSRKMPTCRCDGPSWQDLLHIQHQQDLSIAQQCRSGIATGIGEQPLHRLEDDIEPVADGVDFDRSDPAGSFHDHEKSRRSASLARSGSFMSSASETIGTIRSRNTKPGLFLIRLIRSGVMRTVSDTESIEMPNNWPPASTTMMRDIAIVIGRSSRTVVPVPTLLPVNPAADLLDRRAHHVHTDAAAGNIRDFGSGGKSGSKDQVDNLLVGQSCEFIGRHQSFSEAFRRTTAGSMPQPSSVTSIRNLSPIRDASIEIVAVSGFPAARRCPGLSMP